MVAFKFLAVAAAVVGAVFATDAHEDSVCMSVAPVTVTVTITQCGSNPPVGPTPPASSSYGIPPPSPSGPAPSGSAPSGPAPSAPSGSETSSVPPQSGTATVSQSSSGAVTPTPSESSSHPGSTPPPTTSTPPEQSTNAAAFPTAFPGMGAMVAGGLALNAAIAALV